MADFGLTSAGFVAKALTDLQDDLERELRGTVGDGIDLDAQSVYGQFVGIHSERYADLWEAMAAVYAAFSRDTASGMALDVVCSLTGTQRKAPISSVVTATLTGTDGVTVSAGSLASIGSAGAQFALVDDVLLDGGTGTGLFRAVETGPTVCLAATLTNIVTPVFGWDAVTNAADGQPGSDLETDAALRVRCEAEIAQAGTGTLDAIRGAVLKLTGVDVCHVFENVNDTTDDDGVPPHAFEVLVGTGAGFVEADLLNTIWENKPAGIKSYGDNSGDIVDGQGNTQTLSYSTPTEKDVYVEVHLTVDADSWNESSGPDDVEASMIAYGDAAYILGKDVVERTLTAQAFKVDGVLDGYSYIAFTASPTLSDTLAIGPREFAKISISRITVAFDYGTP